MIEKPKRKGTRIALAVCAAVAVMAAGGIAYYRTGDTEPQVAANLNPKTATPQVMAYPQPQEDAKSAYAPAPLTKPLPSESRTAQIDRLAKGTPAEALQAVKLLQSCAYVEPFERHSADPQADPMIAKRLRELAPASGCDGVMGGQRTMILPLAIKAAQANVPGAFAQLLGMSLQYPEMQDDASLKQAWSDIHQANLKAANPDALMARFQYESNCSDPPKCTGRDLPAALEHWTTYIDATGGKPKYGPDTVTPQLTKAIGPQKAQAAIAQGHAAYANRGQP